MPYRHWKTWQLRLGVHFICVNIAQLATQAAALVPKDEALTAVGTSGTAFAKQMGLPFTALPVETVTFSRAREQRILRVEELVCDTQPSLVDDIAVSGLTLNRARAAVRPEPTVAVVGMLYKSKTTRSRIGVEDLRYCLQYSREGGGMPPVNTVNTLRECPDRLRTLAERYFGDAAQKFVNTLMEATQ